MAKKGMFDFFKSQADEDNKHNANDGYKVSLQRSFGSPEQTTVSAPALNTPDGQQPKENQPHQDSYGVTGQQVFAGFDGEEPNPFLSNRQGISPLTTWKEWTLRFIALSSGKGIK